MSAAERALYFFDTSALVKRYHQEVGTDVIDTIFDEESAVNVISDIGVIEFYSAFAKKIRVDEISEEDFRATIRVLATDLQKGALQLVVFGDEEKKEAAVLLEKHGPSRGLRTLDAMQLAVMKKLGVETITRVYCADRRFVAILKHEGFSVFNPEQVPEEK